ncbi:FKBP-type peptidyl-prolyl cis-trans isomerase [Deltaproteobacteria bacterium TL4]
MESLALNKIIILIFCVIGVIALGIYLSGKNPLKKEDTNMAQRAETNLIEGQKFLEENKNNEGVVVLPSGLQYKIIQEGSGAKPNPRQSVTVHYHGTLIDGTVFDSSYDRGQPLTFGVTQVIPGWVEGLQLMPEGAKWRLFIPYNLAYGKNGAGNVIGPNAALIFDVELIRVN